MVLNNCTICSVYESDETVQKRLRVKCDGEEITLYMKRENELSDSEKIRIDFYDGQIGCVRTYCEVIVRRNYDPSVKEPWIADCGVIEVIEIVEGRRNLRVNIGDEVLITSFQQGEVGVEIQNISEGGLYFLTDTKLCCDDTIEFDYTFVETKFRLKAIVLREEDFRNGRYGYGCEFTELPKGAKRDIQQYVFRRQYGRM
jgi:c-di-GMP-binding flagellar brake protein YcgR